MKKNKLKRFKYLQTKHLNNPTQKNLVALNEFMKNNSLPKPVKIVIEVSDGMVQEVYTDSPITYLLIDRDIEGKKMNKIYSIKGGDCIVCAFDAFEEKTFVNKLFKKHVG